jgi:hypothetical protein
MEKSWNRDGTGAADQAPFALALVDDDSVTLVVRRRHTTMTSSASSPGSPKTPCTCDLRKRRRVSMSFLTDDEQTIRPQ